MHLFCSHTGLWIAKDKALATRTSIILPWIPAASARRRTPHPGWDHRLPTRWPSKPHVAPRTCAAPTPTRTWPPSRCSDAPERSASRFKKKKETSIHPFSTALIFIRGDVMGEMEPCPDHFGVERGRDPPLDRSPVDRREHIDKQLLPLRPMHNSRVFDEHNLHVFGGIQ